MADITITASNVIAQSGAVTRTGIAGAAVTPGAPIYKDTAANNVLKLADADAATTAAVCGLALHPADIGQPLSYIERGNVALGSVLTAGERYVVSTNAGKLCPIADLGSGDYVADVGIAVSATVLAIDLNASGIAKA